MPTPARFGRRPVQPYERVPFVTLPPDVEDANDDTSLGVGSRDAHGWDCPARAHRSSSLDAATSHGVVGNV